MSTNRYLAVSACRWIDYIYIQLTSMFCRRVYERGISTVQVLLPELRNIILAGPECYYTAKNIQSICKTKKGYFSFFVNPTSCNLVKIEGIHFCYSQRRYRYLPGTLHLLSSVENPKTFNLESGPEFWHNQDPDPDQYPGL